MVKFMRLKELREEEGLKQSEIAKLLNIKQNTYSQYETGAREISIDALIKLSSIYNVSTDYIIGITDKPDKY